MYFVYVLRCGDGSFYTGITNDIEKRVLAHNGEVAGGAKYTRVRRPVELFYSETCESRSEALKREYEIKQLTHQEKSQLKMMR